MCGNGKFRLPAQLFLHRFNDVVRHEWLSIVLADVSARDVAGFATQITGELAAVVVLYDDRVPCVFQNVKNRLAVQRHEPANLELVRCNALLAAIDYGIESQILGVNAESACRQQQIAKHNTVALKAVGNVENLGNDFEAISNIERGGNDTRIIAEGSAQHLPEIALLRLGRDARGRASPLTVNYDDRSFHHGGHAEAFTHQGEAAAGGSTHRADASVSGADRHIDYPDLVFHLPHHDSSLARMSRHPVQNAGRRTHRVCAVEFHTRSRSAHGHGGVAAEHRVPVLGHGKWPAERLEIRGGVIIAGPCDCDVFGDHGFAFLLELLGEDLLERLEADAHHAEAGADCECVLGHLVPGDVSQLRNWKRAELYAVRRGAWFDRVSVVNAGSAIGEQAQVAIHGILVQRDQQIDPITHVGDFFRAGTNRQKSVATSNDRLICVVGIQVEPPAAEDFCENVARRRDTLAGGASDTNGKSLFH